MSMSRKLVGKIEAVLDLERKLSLTGYLQAFVRINVGVSREKGLPKKGKRKRIEDKLKALEPAPELLSLPGNLAAFLKLKDLCERVLSTLDCWWRRNQRRFGITVLQCLDTWIQGCQRKIVPPHQMEAWVDGHLRGKMRRQASETARTDTSTHPMVKHFGVQFVQVLARAIRDEQSAQGTEGVITKIMFVRYIERRYGKKPDLSTDWKGQTKAEASAAELARAICDRWEHDLSSQGKRQYAPPPADLVTEFVGGYLRPDWGSIVHEYYQRVLENPILQQTPRQVTSTPVERSRPPRSTILEWEVLPAGDGWWRRPEILQGFVDGSLPGEIEVERIEFLDGLRPRKWYVGKSIGIPQYFVAEFARVAVAECPATGNAIYYVIASAGDWRVIFRNCKAEARQLGAKRILHRTDGNWKAKLRDLVRRHRQ